MREAAKSAGILCVGLVALVQSLATEAQQDAARVGALVIEAHTEGEIRGSFTLDESLVRFRSELRDHLIAVHIEVNTKPFDAIKDTRTEHFSLHGYGGVVSRPDKEALGSLTFALHQRLRASPGEIPAFEDLLLRIVDLLSEAPVGIALPTMEIDKPAKVEGVKP